MLILGVDTSWKQGSIGLLRDGEPLASAPLEGGTFSAQLVPQIAKLLEDNHLSKEDLDGFAVASGPGSFTGLRVGLAAVKAMAEILKKPIAATTVLEAMAAAYWKEGKIASALDAGRGEVFVAKYDLALSGKAAEAKPKQQEVMTRERAAQELSGARVVCCEPAVAELLRQVPGTEVIERPRPDAVAIARLGAAKIARGDVIAPEELDADYIRRSDAELFSGPKP